jgi:adenylate kinase
MAGRKGALLTDRTSVVSMVGVPGSGKSTIGPRLAERFGATYIGTGELLRQRTTTDDALGRRIATLLAGGDIVPDDVVFDVLMAALDAPRPGRLVLDGVPRTVGQMRIIDAGDLAIHLDMVVLLEVPEQVAMARLTARAERSPRPDDKLITHRAAVLLGGMQEVVVLSAEWGILRAVDASGEPADVTNRAAAEIEHSRPRWDANT